MIAVSSFLAPVSVRCPLVKSRNLVTRTSVMFTSVMLRQESRQIVLPERANYQAVGVDLIQQLQVKPAFASGGSDDEDSSGSPTLFPLLLQ